MDIFDTKSSGDIRFLHCSKENQRKAGTVRKHSRPIPLADLGGRARRTPPMGPNSFIFANIFAKKHPHQRSTPLTGARPLREIWIRH